MEFRHLTIQQLKKELVQCGAKFSGRKAELVKRLEDYERNQNFQSAPVLMPAENQFPSWLNSSLFRSLTPEHRRLLPQIERSQIEQYVLYRQCYDKKENQVTKYFVLFYTNSIFVIHSCHAQFINLLNV